MSQAERHHDLRPVEASRDAINPRWEELLGNIPESVNWERRDLEELFAQSSQIDCAAETVLMKPDTMCSGFIIILEGTVRVYQNASDGREVTLYRTRPGDVCVMSLNSLLKKTRFNAVARTETPVRAISINRGQFLKLMTNHELFAVRILSTLTDHFSKTLSLMEDIVFSRLESRLACLLGGMFEVSGGGAIKATHQELANELGTTREVVSRILKTLEQKGCIKLSRGKINLTSENLKDWMERSRHA